MIRLVVVLLWLASAVPAQQLGGQARALPEGSVITHGWLRDPQVTLALSQAVPFRVFVAENPARLVLDFAQVDFSALDLSGLLPRSDALRRLRVGPAPAGWSRLELELTGPMLPEDVDMRVDQNSGSAQLSLRLTDTTAAAFSAAAAEGPVWVQSDVAEKTDKPFTVVIDPGHGGKDPGAQVSGLVEKEIVLGFALELRDLLRRDGVRVVLTRDRDEFLSLQARIARAHAENADLFLSIHADTVIEGQAAGATVYTLSHEASDDVSARLAARQNRGALLSGVDLSETDDEITGVLLDLARRETSPRSTALARAVIAGMKAAGGPVNSHPLRAGGFVVLMSADIPSVLVEIGFLSDDEDRRNLADPIWRSVMAGAIAGAIRDWRSEDLIRQ